jgi:hypothetical protein
MQLAAFARAFLAYFQPLLLLNSGWNQDASLQSRPSFSEGDVVSWPIDLTHLFNNVAVGPHATFDPQGESWAPEFMPKDNVSAGAIVYQVPQKWRGEPDNVVSNGQVITVPTLLRFAREMHILYAGDFIDGVLVYSAFR